MSKRNDAAFQTKEHILEVAREQFFKKGYAATSINHIVDAARVTKPTVYYHFKNKEGLFVALVEDAYNKRYGRLNNDEYRQKITEEKISVAELIYEVVASDFAFCLAEPELVQFVLSLTFSLPEEQTIDLREFHQRDYEFFRDLIEHGIKNGEFACSDVVSAALALQGTIAINIMSYLKMEHSHDFLSPDRAREVANVFLTGILAQPLPSQNRQNSKNEDC